MHHIHCVDSNEVVHSHVSSRAQLIAVFVSLLALTALTVWSSTWDIGKIDIWLAMGIAGLKATLVASYYMHLRYDSLTNSLLLMFTIGILILFLGVTLTDVEQLVPEVEAAGTQSV